MDLFGTPPAFPDTIQEQQFPLPFHYPNELPLAPQNPKTQEESARVDHHEHVRHPTGSGRLAAA